jgi:hypothetical protein
VTNKLRSVLIPVFAAAVVLVPAGAASAGPVLDPPAAPCSPGFHHNDVGQCVADKVKLKPKPCLRLLPGSPCNTLIYPPTHDRPRPP